MKRLSLTSILIFSLSISFAQGVGIGNTAPDSSAALDITSANKGLLIPRMNTTAIHAIPIPARGLLVYDSLVNQFLVNVGTAAQPDWQTIGSTSANGWLLNGNAGTDPASSFVGTSDNQPLLFRINNVPAGQLHPSTGNIFWGLNAGNANTAGFSNVVIGTNALKFDIEGSNLVAIGDSALFNNGKDNPVPGALAISNTAIGSKSLFSNTIGSGNVATGTNALFSNTIGSDNSAYGVAALFSNTTGGLNTAIGTSALSSNTTGNANTAAGFESLNANTTGVLNTALGSSSLKTNTTGNNNTSSGFAAMFRNVSGNDNTADGLRALFSNVTGSRNTATGSMALFTNSTGIENTGIGQNALLNNDDGNGNTAVGQASLSFNSSGSNNSALGSQSLFKNSFGSNNAAIGFQSLFANTSGINNAAVGTISLSSNTTGFQNTAIGSTALFGNVTGNSNTAIGFGADVGSGDLSNATAIGEGAIVNSSNKIRLGNGAVTVIEGQVPFTTPSDGRFKYQVKEDVKGLGFIMALRPVTYQFNVKQFDEQERNADKGASSATVSYVSQASYDEASSIRRSGFIAQEVEKAASRSGYDFSGIIKPRSAADHYSLSYESFVVPLVKAIQEQQQMILELAKQNSELQKRVTALENR